MQCLWESIQYHTKNSNVSTFSYNKLYNEETVTHIILFVDRAWLIFMLRNVAEIDPLKLVWLCGIGSVWPVPIQVSSCFQVPFDGIENWHLGFLNNFSKGKTYIFKSYNALSIANCLFLVIMTAIYFLQCGIVQIKFQRVLYHSMF